MILNGLLNICGSCTAQGGDHADNRAETTHNLMRIMRKVEGATVLADRSVCGS